MINDGFRLEIEGVDNIAVWLLVNGVPHRIVGPHTTTYDETPEQLADYWSRSARKLGTKFEMDEGAWALVKDCRNGWKGPPDKGPSYIEWFTAKILKVKRD